MPVNQIKRRSIEPVTVVITVKNDAVALGELLNLLNKQSRLPDEVVITVAGAFAEDEETSNKNRDRQASSTSSDNATLVIAKSWRPRRGGKQVIPVGQVTRGQGRNLGVAAARHDLIVFTDAGCYPEPNWLDNLLEPFSKSQTTKLVSGFTWVDTRSAWQEAQGRMVLVPLEEIDQHPLPATRNMALRRSVFIKAKGFKPQLNYAEDYELAKRLQQLAVKSEFAPNAKVIWQGRTNLGSYYGMIFYLTRGDILAGTWRFGHFSMWLRYLAFIVTIYLVIQFMTEPVSIIFIILIYIAYLLIKTQKYSFSNRLSYIWSPLLQLVTDMAVLGGTATGLLTLIWLKFKAVFVDSSESLN